MPNTDKTAVEIEWQLETPVREDIYEYIVKGQLKMEEKRKVIKVVAVIIINDGKVFATQRGYGEFNRRMGISRRKMKVLKWQL